MVGEASAGVTLNAVPPQIVVVCVPITGLGFTVIVTVKVLPAQLPKAAELVGVTV